jgi:hypothetical protein
MQILSMSQLLSEMRNNELEYGPLTPILHELLAEYSELVSTAKNASELVAQMAAAHAYMQALLPTLEAKIKLQHGLPDDAHIRVDLELGTFQVGTKKAPEPPSWAEEVLKSTELQ